MLTLATPRAQIRIEPGQPSRLTGARHACLKSAGGTLWVTVDKDPRDFVLEPGEGMQVDSNEMVLITAMGGPAVLELRS